MANIRRGGQVKFIKVRVDADSVIEKGDMLWLDTSGSNPVARPASELSWDTNIATTQAAFADVFLGIAFNDSADGETDDIHVDISPYSVWEMACTSDTYADFALLGPAKQASANLLSDTNLVDAVAAGAVARADKYYASATTRVEARFMSAYDTMANNANAQVG